MATVTGKTSAKIDELLNATIKSAALDGDGQFTLTTRGGATINAGSVSNAIVSAVVNGVGRLILTARNGATVDAGLVSRPIDSWPVGSIFIAATSTNPNTLLGGGTWVAWGQGRVPVSVDPGQAEFDALEETGGVKYHTLSEAEMPYHAHAGSANGGGSHNHTGTTSTDAHSHTSNSRAGEGGSTVAFARSGSAAIGTYGGMVGVDSHAHTMTATTAAAHTHSLAISAAGGNAAHTNMQPYITCYMWKRTA